MRADDVCPDHLGRHASRSAPFGDNPIRMAEAIVHSHERMKGKMNMSLNVEHMRRTIATLEQAISELDALATRLEEIFDAAT